MGWESGRAKSFGPEDAAKATEASSKANALRREWAIAIANGDHIVLDVLREEEPVRRAVRKLPLVHILMQIEGWSRDSATNALLRNGMNSDAKLGMLLRNQRLNRVFTEMMDTGFQRWVPNINFPEGYPFLGKIEDVLAQGNVAEYMPKFEGADTSEVQEDDGDAGEKRDSENDENSAEADLDSLLGDLDI